MTHLQTRDAAAYHHGADQRVFDAIALIGDFDANSLDYLLEYVFVRRDQQLAGRTHRGLRPQWDKRRPIAPCTNCPRCHFFAEKIISFRGKIILLLGVLAVGMGLVLGAGWRFFSPLGVVLAVLLALLVLLGGALVLDDSRAVRRWRRQAARLAGS